MKIFTISLISFFLFLSSVLSSDCPLCHREISDDEESFRTETFNEFYHKKCLYFQFFGGSSFNLEVNIGRKDLLKVASFYPNFMIFSNVVQKYQLNLDETIECMKEAYKNCPQDESSLLSYSDFCVEVLVKVSLEHLIAFLDWSTKECELVFQRVIVSFYDVIVQEMFNLSMEKAFKSYQFTELEFFLSNYIYFNNQRAHFPERDYIQIRNKIRNFFLLTLIKNNSPMTAMSILEKNPNFLYSCILGVAMLEQGYPEHCNTLIEPMNFRLTDCDIFSHYYIVNHSKDDAIFQHFFLNLNERERKKVANLLAPFYHQYSEAWIWIVERLQKDFLIFEALVQIDNITVLPLQVATGLLSKFSRAIHCAALAFKNLKYLCPATEKYFEPLINSVKADRYLLKILQTQATNSNLYFAENFIMRCCNQRGVPFVDVVLPLAPSEAFVQIPALESLESVRIYAAFLVMTVHLNDMQRSDVYSNVVFECLERNLALFRWFHCAYAIYFKRDLFWQQISHLIREVEKIQFSIPGEQ